MTNDSTEQSVVLGLDAPRVTIGIPVFNGQAHIAQALDSILAQEFEDFEVIVSDNASTDDTPDIVRSFSARDPRIRYEPTDRNVGLIANFNRLVGLAKGGYFQWMAYDDLILPGYLSACVAALDRESDCCVAYTRSTAVDDTGQILDINEARFTNRSRDAHERWEDAIEQIWTTHGLLTLQYGLIRIDALKKTRLLGDYPGSDSIFLTELVLQGGFVEVPEELFVRRVHPQRVTERFDEPSDRLRVLSGGRRKRFPFPYWTYLVEYLKVLNRASIPMSEKVQCLPSLIRYYVGTKYRSFAGDLVRPMLRALRRRRSNGTT